MFRIGHDPYKGRSAIATQRLSPGTRLLTTDAYAAVSLTACNSCFRSRSLQSCGGCQLLKYCSRKCQQRDWTHGNHRLECNAWKQIPPLRASQTVLLVARLAMKIIQEKRDDHDVILTLRSHYADHTPTQRLEFTNMAQLVLLILSRSKATTLPYDILVERHEPTIVELFCRVNCNAFTICDDVNDPVGIGMFPQAAQLNHSCIPNCVVSFAGHQLHIHVISTVEPGDELTISYVELLEATPKRQAAMRSSYFFECHCQRCVQAEIERDEDTVLDGFVCRNGGCKEGIVVVNEDQAVCTDCGDHMDATVVLNALHRLETAETELRSSNSLSVPEKWALHQQIWHLVDQELQCHPRSTKYANTARAIGNFLIDHKDELDNVASAKDFLLKERDATAWLLPTLALPSRGLLSFQLAKLSTDNEAKSFIREALSVLSTALGRDHRMVHTAQAFLDELSMTLS